VVEWIGLNKYRFDTTFLISASPMDFVQKIVSPLNIFDEIIGSKTVNLKGHTKLNYITTNLNANFCYIGDSIADIPLFKSSSEAYLVKKGKLKKIK
jgi:phosphoserine phosphatase